MIWLLENSRVRQRHDHHSIQRLVNNLQTFWSSDQNRPNLKFKLPSITLCRNWPRFSHFRFFTQTASICTKPESIFCSNRFFQNVRKTSKNAYRIFFKVHLRDQSRSDTRIKIIFSEKSVVVLCYAKRPNSEVIYWDRSNWSFFKYIQRPILRKSITFRILAN